MKLMQRHRSSSGSLILLNVAGKNVVHDAHHNIKDVYHVSFS